MNIGFLYEHMEQADLKCFHFYENVEMAVKTVLDDSNNYFQVHNLPDLQNNDIECLFILNDHHQHSVFGQNNFLQYLNEQNIRTVIFNYELINSPFFPWNLDIQRTVDSIKNCYQLVADTTDGVRLNKALTTKQYLSRQTDLGVDPIPFEDKKDKIIFIGNIYDEQYASRGKLLEHVSNMGLDIPVEVIKSDYKLPFSEYISMLNESKYVLNPFGTGKFVNVRHYEALELGCRPIQQIIRNNDFLKYYPELIDRGMTFETPEEIPLLLQNEYIPEDSIYLEDYLQEIKLAEIIQ